jgi:hypothetical protein
MDVAGLTAFLAPLLPALLNIGGRVAQETVDAAGDEAVGFARRLWEKLRGKVEAKPAAEEAVKDVAENPQDEDLQTVLRVQLKKLLDEDPDLAAELSQLWDEGKATGAVTITVTASGAGSVAVGRDAVGSPITTTAPPPPKE